MKCNYSCPLPPRINTLNNMTNTCFALNGHSTVIFLTGITNEHLQAEYRKHLLLARYDDADHMRV